MKKLQLLFIAMTSMASSMMSYAQEKGDAVSLPTVTVTSVRHVDSRLNRAFRRAFPHAQDLQWYRQDKDYLAKFIKDDLRHQALFKKNGYIQYDIGYGLAHHLTQDMGYRVTELYKGYVITYVAKVTRNSEVFWIINLEGIKDFVIVRLEQGSLQEVRRIDKAEN